MIKTCMIVSWLSRSDKSGKPRMKRKACRPEAECGVTKKNNSSRGSDDRDI